MHLHKSVLALDLGASRSGVALLPAGTNTPVTLPTLTHKTLPELRPMLESLIADRGVGVVVVGLPLLPSGEAGKQANLVREWVAALGLSDVEIAFQDERFSTPRHSSQDPDSEAALAILQTWLNRQNKLPGKSGGII